MKYAFDVYGNASILMNYETEALLCCCAEVQGMSKKY